jgi:hypothetical protein
MRNAALEIVMVIIAYRHFTTQRRTADNVLRHIARRS